MAVPYLRPVGIPRPLTTLPDPNVTWMFQIVRNWDYLQKADAGLVGVPFDGAVVTGRQVLDTGLKLLGMHFMRMLHIVSNWMLIFQV